MDMTNNELFNRLLNNCNHPQEVYALLLTLFKPGVQQGKDVGEKGKVIVGQLLARLDEPKANK